MALIPSPSTVEDRTKEICPKCGEQCIYLLGERAGLNEEQTETVLIKLHILKP